MSDRLQELRDILFSKEQQKIETLEHKIDDARLNSDELADLLPDAFVEKSSDKRLIRALEKPVAESVRASIIRDTDAFAELLFPVMSPAIRRSIVETVRSMMQNISQVIDQSFSLRGLSWRLESLRTNVPFHEIVLRNTLLYRVEQVFLIHNDSGLLIRHITSDETSQQDPDAVSAMLTAIQDFTSDSFATEESSEHLAKIDTESHTIWLTPGRKAHLACVISGIPPSGIRNHFSDVLTDVHQEFSDKLQAYRGDKDDFILADELLRSCLLSEQKEPEKRRSVSRIILPLIAIGVVGLLGWFGYQEYQQHQRFNVLKEKLSAIPGVAVMSASIKDNEFHFTGLRDPLSDDPAKVLTDDSEPEETVHMHWRPYLALEEPLIIKRVHNALQPPESVQLDVKAGVIHASGVASSEWQEKCRDLGPALPGIRNCITEQVKELDAVLLNRVSAALDIPQTATMSVEDAVLHLEGKAPMAWIKSIDKQTETIESLADVDTSGLSAIEHEELETLAVQVEASHVYFESNSTEIIADENLQSLTKTIGRIADLSSLLDRETIIVMTGRTFGDVHNSANIELAKKRADNFHSLLVNEHNVPASLLVIDQDRPADPAHALLNARRLDFVVITAPQEK